MEDEKKSNGEEREKFCKRNGKTGYRNRKDHGRESDGGERRENEDIEDEQKRGISWEKRGIS